MKTIDSAFNEIVFLIKHSQALINTELGAAAFHETIDQFYGFTISTKPNNHFTTQFAKYTNEFLINQLSNVFGAGWVTSIQATSQPQYNITEQQAKQLLVDGVCSRGLRLDIEKIISDHLKKLAAL